jgi:hypothetical protein
VNLAELKAEFGRMEREAFRLQQLQSYGGVDGPEWDAWRAGEPIPPITPEVRPFLGKLAEYTAAGKRVYQVHIIEWPLAEYVKYALAVIPMSAWSGTETFMVDRTAHPDLATLTEDFWLFDERLAAVMRYDGNEAFVGAEESSEPVETWIARRDLAMKYAIRFERWMAEHQEWLEPN